MGDDTINNIEDLNRIIQQYANTLYNIGQQNNFYGFSAKGLLPYKNSPYLSKVRDLFKAEIEFFPENEILQINNILQIVKGNLAPFALVTGNPASGKSVFAYKIATDFENCDNDYKAYYYTCREGMSPSDLYSELKFYDEMNPKIKKLYIIDDIHLSPERILYFFDRLKNEHINCSILFVSRIIEEKDNKEGINKGKNNKEGIYAELENATFELEFSLCKINKDQSVDDVIKINKKSMNKINGIVQKFCHKNDFVIPSKEVINNLFNKTGFDLLNLFYHLSVWKEESNDNRNIELDSINESDVFRHIYFENLYNLRPVDREVIIKYACIYQYETWFEIQQEDYIIIKSLMNDGIIVRDNKGYSFYHSKFAELLIKSFISCDEFYEIKYQSFVDLVTQNISNYIKSYLYNRVRKYPNNIFELFDGMLGARNRYLHNGLKEKNVKENSIIFNSLIKDNEIKNIVLSFFDNSDIDALKTKKFMDYISKYANELYMEFQISLILKNDFLWLKYKLIRASSTDNFLAFILFVNEYKNFYKIFSDEEIRNLIRSGSNPLKNLFGIKDVEIRKFVMGLLSKEEWFLLFKSCSIDKIEDALFDIEKKDNEFAVYLCSQFSDSDLIEKIKENFVIGLTRIIPILQKLDKERAKILISEFDNEYIIKNILWCTKKNNEDGNLQIVSDFIQQIYYVDKDKAMVLLSCSEFNEILLLLNSINLPQMVSFYSELKEINDKIARDLFNWIDFDLLCNKIEIEPANKILNSLSEIRRLNEGTARSLMFYAKETLIKTIPEIKLETFLSYEKNGLIVMEASLTSEIMGRLPDEYIRNYEKLDDMRDIIRLISLYRYVDLNLWDKEYLLSEIFDYVDTHFEEKFLHKKWLPSTMRLLDICSLFDRKIKSVSHNDSKTIFKDILLAKGNLGHFARNIAIIKKHSQELAKELELELSFQLDIINSQMKGAGLFMNTILIEVMKFLGSSIGGGITWDILKNGSSKIVERFKKKFVEEGYFDEEEKCVNFFKQVCTNISYNPDEPLNDVNNLYRFYAKGKPYDIFEEAFIKWLKTNSPDMTKNANQNSGKTINTVFYKSDVTQEADEISNIVTQNNYNSPQESHSK